MAHHQSYQIGLQAGTAIFHESATFNVSPVQSLPSASPPPYIWFNVQNPIKSFVGRDEVLKELHGNLQKEIHFPNFQVIVGLGGIGKTELVRMYIERYKSFYNNIIWIHAETQVTIQQSLKSLAKRELQLESEFPTKNKSQPTKNKKELDFPSLIRKLYEKLCRHSTLIIFDNASHYDNRQQNSHNNGILPFLPKSLPPNLVKPRVLITSRNFEWGHLQSSIRHLGFLSQNESTQFVIENLDLTIVTGESLKIKLTAEDESIVETLCKYLGGLPLALQQALAYLRMEWQRSKFNVPSPTLAILLTTYIQLLESSAERRNLLKFPPFESAETVATTWDVTFQKIKEGYDDGGQKAIHVMELLSFFSADGIPLNFFNSVCTFIFGQENISSCSLSLLENFALLSLEKGSHDNVDSFFIKIHRLVQHVVLESLANEGRFQSVALSLLYPCIVVTESIPSLDVAMGQILLNAKSLVTNSSTLLPNELVIDFMHYLSFKFDNFGNYGEASALMRSVLAVQKQFFTHNPMETLLTEHNLAVSLQKHGKFIEAIQLTENIVPKDMDSLNLLDPVTRKSLLIRAISGFESGNRRPIYWDIWDHAMMDVSGFRQSYSLSNSELRKIIDKRRKIIDNWYKLHPTMVNVLDVRQSYSEDRDGITLFEEYLLHRLKYDGYSVAWHVFKETREYEYLMARRSSPKNLMALQCMAHLRKEEGSYKEALELFVELSEIQITMFGKDHPDHLTTQHNIATMKCDLGWFESGLDLFQHVHALRSKVLGPDHPDTIRTLHTTAQVYMDQKKYEEALEILEKVLSLREKVLGTTHPDYLTAVENKAQVLTQQRDFQSARQLFHEILTVQQFLKVDSNNLLLLTTKHNLAVLDAPHKSAEEALSIFQELVDTHKNIWGEKHPNYLTSLCNLATAFQNLNRNVEAMDCLKKVLEEREKNLGAGHQLTMEVKVKLGNLMMNQGTFKEAMKMFTNWSRSRDAIYSYDFQQVMLKVCNIFSASDRQECENFFEIVWKARKILLGLKSTLTIESGIKFLSVLNKSRKDFAKIEEEIDSGVREAYRSKVGLVEQKDFDAVTLQASLYRLKVTPKSEKQIGKIRKKLTKIGGFLVANSLPVVKLPVDVFSTLIVERGVYFECMVHLTMCDDDLAKDLCGFQKKMRDLRVVFKMVKVINYIL